MRVGNLRTRWALSVALMALAAVGCGGPTLEEQVTSALDQTIDQRSKPRKHTRQPSLHLDGSSDSTARPPATSRSQPQVSPAQGNVGSPSDSSMIPTLRIGDAKVRVDRHQVDHR